MFLQPKISQVKKNKKLYFADAKKTAENSPHSVAGMCLHVSLLEDQEKIIADDHQEASGSQEDAGAEITIIASGIPPSSSEDSVRYYFENSRRSGGGEVCDIDLSHDGKAVITFNAVEGMNNQCPRKQRRSDENSNHFHVIFNVTFTVITMQAHC